MIITFEQSGQSAEIRAAVRPIEKREFFPVFDDSGRSYETLLQCINQSDQSAALQKLINQLAPLLSKAKPAPSQLKLLAAALLLRDLCLQDWFVWVEQEKIFLSPATAQWPPPAPVAAKAIARQQGLFARAEQLSEPTARRIILALERPGRGSAALPITKLIADGRVLADALEPIARLPKSERSLHLAQLIKPYLQLVEPDKRCALTGIKLSDIWRYFRWMWSTPYNTSPGRNLYFLIRDAGQPFHPVMGITALGNTVMQLNCRDRRLGWTPNDFVALVDKGVITHAEAIACLQTCLKQSLDELHVDDLNLSPDEIQRPTSQTLSRLLALREEAARQRQAELERQERPQRIEFKNGVTSGELEREMQTTLYRYKRAKAAGELLRARMILNEKLTSATPEALRALLSDEEGTMAVGVALRQARNRLSGSAMMELTVCGGVPPYSWLLGGKLACLLMLSPEVAHHYEARYSNQISIIASQMAGRPIRRSARLAYLGTTSLYAAGSSQYNRVALPAATLPCQRPEIKYELFGQSQGYGSAHLSQETHKALKSLENESAEYRRVKNVFGEGANPKMRQLAGGLSAMGLANADLLKHASPTCKPFQTTAKRKCRSSTTGKATTIIGMRSSASATI